MQETIRGVIVKIPVAGSSKICLLTREYGKVPVVVFNQYQRARMRLGNIVQSFVQQDQYNMFVADSVELIAQPHVHHHDLGWFHHLLEISYFFCPMHQPASEVYVILEKSLSLLQVHYEQKSSWALVQISLVGCLLILFGFYPPAPFEIVLNPINRLLAMTIDFHQPQNLELLTCSAAMLQEHDLDQYHAWLLACIKTHPRISGFKTLPFVYKTI